MRQVFLLFFALNSIYALGQTTETPSLELIQLSQITPVDSLPFDLSGIVEVDNKIYIVADKNWNRYIYEAKISNGGFYATEGIPLSLEDQLDLEAIDYCNDQFYLANEKTGDIYGVAIKDSRNFITKLPLDFERKGHDLSKWGNAGWEGLAVDCERQILYLIKERQPRIIFVVDAQKNQIIDEFNIPETDSNDFSDAKFMNGFLYLLERYGNYIAKIDPETQKVVSKVTYKDIASHPHGKLYKNSKYGMAEGLLLRENEIWVALDNNGNTVSDHAMSTYNMRGKSPVILKFKRPKGF